MNRQRKTTETFKAYRSAQKVEQLLLDQHLQGTPIWHSAQGTMDIGTNEKKRDRK